MYIIFICNAILHVYLSYLLYVIIMYITYVCNAVLCSLYYMPAPYSVTALHNDYCITAAARERPPISLWSTRRRGTPVKRALQRRSTMRSAGAAPFARAARARSGTARAQRPVRTPPAGGHTGTGGSMIVWPNPPEVTSITGSILVTHYEQLVQGLRKRLPERPFYD